MADYFDAPCRDSLAQELLAKVAPGRRWFASKQQQQLQLSDFNGFVLARAVPLQH